MNKHDDLSVSAVCESGYNAQTVETDQTMHTLYVWSLDNFGKKSNKNGAHKIHLSHVNAPMAEKEMTDS